MLEIAQPEFGRMDFPSPTPADVMKALHMLDGIHNLYLTFGRSSHVELFVFAAPGAERYIVWYAAGTIARLVDETVPQNEANEENRVDYTWENGQVDDVPLWETVTLEKAAEVLMYFIEHEKIPRHLTWHGWYDFDFIYDLLFD